LKGKAMFRGLFGKKKPTFTKKLLMYIADEQKLDYLIKQGIFFLTVNVYYTSFYGFYRMFENNHNQKCLNRTNIELGVYLNNDRDNLKKLLEILIDPTKKDNEYIEKDREEIKSTIEMFFQTLGES
jgi:hypothetical protein